MCLDTFAHLVDGEDDKVADWVARIPSPEYVCESAFAAKQSSRIIYAVLTVQIAIVAQPPTRTNPLDQLDLKTEWKDISKRQRNFWYRYSGSPTTVVFVHGHLSCPRDCWREPHSREYWPDLVWRDDRLGKPNIFLGGFTTGVKVTQYEIRDCAEELYSAIRRMDVNGRPAPLDHERIVFICHSLGGVVARYMLESHKEAFYEKQVALGLFGSPAYGSVWASLASFVAEAIQHKTSLQLQRGHTSLRDLDSRFVDLIHDRLIPGLVGIEVAESKPLFSWMCFPVVGQSSAHRHYFAGARKLADRNHSQLVRPRDLTDEPHGVLVDLFTKSMQAAREQLALDGTSSKAGRQRRQLLQKVIEAARSGYLELASDLAVECLNLGLAKPTELILAEQYRLTMDYASIEAGENRLEGTLINLGKTPVSSFDEILTGTVAIGDEDLNLRVISPSDRRISAFTQPESSTAHAKFVRIEFADLLPADQLEFTMHYAWPGDHPDETVRYHDFMVDFLVESFELVVRARQSPPEFHGVVEIIGHEQRRLAKNEYVCTENGNELTVALTNIRFGCKYRITFKVE